MLGLAQHKGVTSIRSDQNDTLAATRLLEFVQTSLDDDKAEDVAVVDLAGKTTIADHMVVACGRSQRQVGAIAEHLTRRLKDAGFGASRVEGMSACDWVLIDAGDVIIHVFRPEVRGFYNLEKMWSAELAVAERAVS